MAKETIDIVFKHSVLDFCATQGTEWHFITPVSPWKGAVYERLHVTSLVKRSLRKTIRSTPIEEYHMITLLAEIQAMLNSRPLVYVGSDINSSIILTPAHFLNLHVFPSIPNLDYSDPSVEISENASKKRLIHFWLKGQKHLQLFWKLLKKQYITALREKHIMNMKQSRIKHYQTPKIGDIVIILTYCHF